MFDCIPLSLSRQSAKIDTSAGQKYFLEPEVLMEAAGALAAGEILKYFGKTASSFIVMCGPGHNGGDGLVLARHLYSHGLKVQVFCDKKSGSDLLEKQKKRLTSQKLKIHPIAQYKNLKVSDDFLIVDALFGVGLSRDVKGIYKELIEWMNAASCKIVSLDTPSGLNVDTGIPQGVSVKASLTLTFGLAKPGFYLMQGPAHTGQLVRLPIGFPQALLSSSESTHFLVDDTWVLKKLPSRCPEDHKARQGHLLVLAGREGFWGAGELTSLAAYRMGCGYVTWSGGDGTQHPPLGSVPDVLTGKLSDPKLLSNKTAVAIGPGFGTEDRTKEWLLALKKTNQPVVVDADAFTVCVREPNLFPLPENWILTPHSGELGRLFGLKGEDIDQDRTSYAIKASQKTGALVLLKGFRSVLAYGKKCGIIASGNAALAKAGTGDVLTGFIGALLARSLKPFEATAVASFVHGKIADNWVQSGKDADTLMAQDLKELLPEALQQLRGS